MSGSLIYWRLVAKSAGLLALTCSSVACLEAPPPDLTYPRADVSEEVFRVFCRRVARDAYPTESDGQRFYAICDGVDEDGDELDPEDETMPQLKALLRRRPEIVDSLDRVFGETDVDGGDKFKDGELSGFLQALVPLYDKPLETIPTATRGIAQLLAQLIDPEDERAQKVLATVERLSRRTGYRAPNRNLGAVRALFTYPELDKLAQTLLPVITADGAAHTQWVNVLNAAALELADEPVAVPNIDDTTLHTALSLLLKVDDAQASGNVGAATVLLRDKANGDALAVAGATGEATPFAIAGRDDGVERDPRGIALSGGKPMYETIDASKTLLASLMRETSLLIGRGEEERSPLENFAHGLKPLLGPWTTQSQRIGANDYSFEGPDVGKSALLEAAHAFASMARYPEAAPLVRTLDALIREHENEATAFDYASLAIDELSDKYEEAKLNGPHEFWDDLLAVGVRMTTRPGMIEALIRSFADPRSGAQGKLFATWMRYKDEVSYPNSPSDAPEDFNKPVEQKYAELVERGKPDVGMNRSIWQRTMSLINALNGVPVCNKEGAILNASTGIGVLTFPFGDVSGAGYKKCDLIEVPDAVEIYGRAVIGKSQIAIKDSFAEILSIFGSLTGISGSVAQIQESESKITGFTDKPTPRSLARFLFAPRNKWLTDLFTPQESVDKVSIALYEPNGLFPIEVTDERTDFDGKASSFLELGQPLVEAFDKTETRNPLDNKLTDGYMFGHTLSVFHKHWSSRKDGPCPAEVTPGNEGCTQHVDRGAPFYSPQTGLVSYEELLAEAFDDQRFVEILHQATVALAAIKVPGPDGAEIDGITALANFTERLLTPDPTLFKRDGKTNSTETNLCVRQGDTCKGDVGRVITPLAPMHLVADALKAMDDTFKEPANKDRLEYWHAGRSGILDQVLTVDRTGSEGAYKYRLRDRTAWGISNSVLPWLAERIETHQQAGDLPKWADGLSGRAETILKHPLTAAVVDLLDAFWPEAEASGEFTKIVSYLTDEGNEDAYLGMLTAAADSLVLLDRDPNLSPAIQFAALGLAPNAFQAIEGAPPNGDKSVAYAGLELTGGVVEELNKKKEPGTQTALSKLLKNLALGDDAQRSPLEVLLDATADVNRPDDTAEPVTPLTAEENRDVFSDVKSFLYDEDQEKRSLERLYTVIQGRKIKK